VRLVKIGEETSEQLDYQPASLFVTEHVRFKDACRVCQESVVTSPRPAQPIDEGKPGSGLLAQVVTAKYADHLPLNRQVDIFGRHGVALSRQRSATGWRRPTISSRRSPRISRPACSGAGYPHRRH
jgi:transposase